MVGFYALLNIQSKEDIKKENKIVLPVIIDENNDNKKFVIVYDNYDVLNVITDYIKQQFKCDIFQINEKIDIDNYDIVLIGSLVAEENMPTQNVQNFIIENKFENQVVSFYWIGGTNHEEYERNLKILSNIKTIAPGLGFNGDEISEQEDLKYFIDGWLTSTYWFMNY